MNITIETIKAMRVAEAIAAVEAHTGQIVIKRTKAGAIECLRRHTIRQARFEAKIKG